MLTSSSSRSGKKPLDERGKEINEMARDNMWERAWRKFARFAEAMDYDERFDADSRFSDLDRMQRAQNDSLAAATRQISALASRIDTIEAQLGGAAR